MMWTPIALSMWCCKRVCAARHRGLIEDLLSPVKANCKHQRGRKAKESKQVNYTQGRSFSKERRRVAPGGIRAHDTLQSRQSTLTH